MSRVELKDETGTVFCLIETDERQRWLHTAWRPAHAANRRRARALYDELSTRYQGYSLLADCREADPAPDCYEQALQLNARRVAQVLPEADFEALPPEALEEHLPERNLTIKRFCDLGVARRWLLIATREGR